MKTLIENYNNSNKNLSSKKSADEGGRERGDDGPLSLGREAGFKKSIRAHGMSFSQSIIHELSPSINGAYSDMKEILKWNEPLARCYFADNDLIAAGAIKAFKEAGKRIPEDIAVVGFDNIPMSQVMDLSTINVPKEYMGRLAAKRLFDRIRNPRLPTVKIAVETTLIDRYSC